MLSKNTRKLNVFIILVSVMVAFTSCGISGDQTVNQPPTVSITSYTGTDIIVDGNPVPWQQNIFWSGIDVDGTIIGYAYRISNEFGEPISTPGNMYVDDAKSLIDTLEVVTPEDLRTKYGRGWVIHYQKGASESIALNEPETRKTVWTEKVSTVVNFPANIDGKLAEIASKFEVIAIDNRGAISEPVVKYFYAQSIKPYLNISSSKGQLNNQIIGQGLKVLFVMTEADSLIVGGALKPKPWYYKFRVYQTALNDTTNILPGSDTNWYTTLNEPNIKEVVLTGSTTPRLLSNYDGDTQISTTVIQAKVVDLAGVESDPISTQFYVSDKFTPQSLFYYTHTYAVGNHHHVLVQDVNIENDIVPSINSSTGTRVATNFNLTPVFNESNEIVDYEFTVVGDATTRFWFRWGYKGEYEDNNPAKELRGKVLDHERGLDYKSEISYYHIQLDDQQYKFEPLLKPGLQPDPNWLKIPASHEIAKKISFVGLEPGLHTFRVIVEDMQGKKDDTPAEFKFRLIPPNTVNDRNGILFIDNHTSLQTTYRDFYMNPTDGVLKGLNATYIHRNTLRNSMISYLNNLEGPGYVNVQSVFLKNGDKDLFSVALLQNYKHVFYTAELFTESLQIYNDYSFIRLYMRNGGNVALIGNKTLPLVNINFINQISPEFPREDPWRFLENYFGLPVQAGEYGLRALANNAQDATYYHIGSTGLAGYPTGRIELNPDKIVEQALRNNIANRAGSPSASFIVPNNATHPTNVSGTPIYLFNCKPVNADDRYSPASEAVRSIYHDSIIGMKKKYDATTGTGHVITFPLIHLVKEDAINTIRKIIE